MKKIILSIFIFLFLLPVVFATHNRAGEITYTYVSGLTYQIHIVTYTYTLSPADRPTLDIDWGDGTTGTIDRMTITQIGDVSDHIQRNDYDGPTGVHTYAGQGSYIISLEDPNRNAGIINMINSVDIPFYIETLLVINPFLGPNSSPELLNPPIDNACVYEPFIHNPAAHDPDGDSLAYHLVICKGGGGLDIPSYTYPAASSSFSLNSITGDLVWDSPVTLGEYNVAFVIEEYRYGIMIGRVRRDMQITVVSCNNDPPVINDVMDTCVEAGTLLTFPVTATDPDISTGYNIITLTGTGGPLVVSISPAVFNEPSPAAGSVTGQFTWQTECAHVRKQPYQMVFKAIDNGLPVRLADFESVFITVVCPSPKNLTASPFGNSIHLSWNPVVCQNAKGYKIYRRNGFYGFIPGHCETGVPAYTGYSKIAEFSNITTTNFTDDDNGVGLIHGNDYCYMVIAYFDDGAESYASNEACTTLIKDVPVITNVSVIKTDFVNGVIHLAWSKPTQLDTAHAQGPYTYVIFRADTSTFAGAVMIHATTSGSINDTTYNDSLINTQNKRYFYRIDMWNEKPLVGDTFLIGNTNIASSIFLHLVSSDNQLLLVWKESVPWTNFSHTVYRQNPSTLLFDSIGISYGPSFADTGLINGVTYCYYVKSTGHYSAPGFVDPIINLSQIVCGTPIDKTPPCDPQLMVLPDCDNVENQLIWTDPNHSCCGDVVSYNIYYSPTQPGNLELIHTNYGHLDTTFIHTGLTSIAGCYAVTAVDSFNNESSIGNMICLDIDSCNLYSLPNVFTPNGDSYNDLFGPFPYDFVDKVNMTIYNRWGEIEYKTENPDINWDGKNFHTKLMCPDGVYYYICDVYEIRLNGIKKRTINGFIHLIRH